MSAPGVTTGEPPDCQQGTFEGTVGFNGFDGVSGAGRKVTAVTGHERTDGIAVNMDENQ